MPPYYLLGYCTSCCVPPSHCLQVWENLPPCHLTMYYIVLCVAVCAIVLLSFACIAIPCKFWKTCHHATYLSIRWSCMLLRVLSYCHMCVLLYPARFGKSATMPPTYLLGSLMWYCLMCILQCLTSLGKSATMPPTYLLGSLTCCCESYYVIALCVDCNPLQILENMPPRHLAIYKVVLCGIALCVDCYTLQV